MGNYTLRADLHKLKKVPCDTSALSLLTDSDRYADRTWAGFLGINAVSCEEMKREFMDLYLMKR